MSRSKVAALARLAHVYTLIETQKAASLSRATLALQKTEQELADQTDLTVRIGASSLDALLQGQRTEWLLCESERECSTRNVADLETVRKYRREARNDVLQQYLISLQKKDQMNATLEATSSTLRNVQELRRQASLDDRFSARSSWIKARERRRMNLS